MLIKNADWTDHVTWEVEHRFWSHVDILDDKRCWECDLHKSGGYVQIGVHGRIVYAHILSYFIKTGDYELVGFQVMHLCHNKGCVNPKHLRKGTASDNLVHSLMSDRPMKQKLTVEQVIEIDQRLLSGDSRNDIARDYDVAFTTIQSIESGLNWSWLTGR